MSAILRAVEAGVDGAFNVGQDETVTIDDFLSRLAALAGAHLEIVRRPVHPRWERLFAFQRAELGLR